MAEDFDCIIVGGGPAGLPAAVYLSRFRRNVCMIGNGRARAALIPISHNIPGFPEGISGDDLLSRMRQHAATYDADLIDAKVIDIRGEVGSFNRRRKLSSFGHAG